MKKVIVIFGPEGGNTEKAARMVAAEFGEENAVLLPVKGATEADLELYDNVIFGGPTVGTHTWRDNPESNDWDLFLSGMRGMSFGKKKCAIFGLGDHIGYADHFVDDIGVMAERLESADAQLVGRVPVSGYTFNHSKAQRGQEFLGLPLDEDFEQEMSQERISKWVLQLQKEFV